LSTEDLSGETIDTGRRFLITLSVMSATVMQALDTTIVNVALPHMQGDLSATPKQITWILTSYLVASGIFMPLTGFFTDRFGQKRYLVYSIAGFVMTSALCGIATGLNEMVFFRLMQGVFGAALIPLSQAIMVQTFPPHERGRAMAIWGIGVMVGPIMGPTLGGYLTEILNWRWTFFINLPVGVLSLLLAWTSAPDSPRKKRPMDWYSLGYLAIAFSALQFTLDYGNEEGWFQSHWIQLAAILSIGGFAALIYRSLTHKGPVLFHLSIFRDRNFATSTLLMAFFGLGLFGALVLHPMMLEGLFGYPTFDTGLVMAPRGLASMVSMMVVGRIIGKYQPRSLVMVGMVLCLGGSWAMTRYSIDSSTWSLVWPIIIQGSGLGLIFVPLSTVAFDSLPREQSAEAAGLYSLTRTIGSSIGISVVATMMTREAQVSWNQLGGHINPYNPAVSHYLANLGLKPTDPHAVLLLTHELARQAQMQGILDAFVLVAWSFIIMMPLALLLGSVKGQAPAAAAGE
jgi:DHA2 family multidrug resistance protein